MDLGRKMEPSLHPDGIKNRWQLRNAIKKKRRFSVRKTMILKVLEAEVATETRLKIHPKMKASWEGLLASIFHGFSSILEAKMEPSWEGKSIRNRSKKASKNRCQTVALRKASGTPLGGLLAAS